MRRLSKNPKIDSDDYYMLGYAAAAQGKARVSPYIPFSGKDGQWKAGYDAGKADMKKASKWFPPSSRYRRVRRNPANTRRRLKRLNRNPLFGRKRKGKRKKRAKSSPFNQGRLVGARGGTSRDNPYQDHTKAAYQWHQGWLHGKKHGLPKKREKGRKRKKVSNDNSRPKLTVVRTNLRGPMPKRETGFIIEALWISYTPSGKTKTKYYWFNGTNLDDKKANAKVYASRAEANQDAKRIMSSVPGNIANLRVVGV